MRLIKAVYTNFKQHRKLELDFTGNVIALIGANGKGKSNVIGGIQFAFTGEQPGFNKDELTTWGEKSGSVTVVFSHENVEWTLTRSTSSASASLAAPGTKTIVGVKAVDAALREKIGIDPDIARQAIFVNQAEIDSVLFSLPRERELAFQRLVGIGGAQKIYDGLTRSMSALAVPEDYTKQISDLMLRKSQLLGIKEQALTEDAELRLRLLQFKSPDSVAPQVELLSKVIAAKIKYYSNQMHFVNVTQSLGRLKDQLKPEPAPADAALIEKLRRNLETHTANIKAGDTMLAQWFRYEQAKAQFDAAAAAFDSTRQHSVADAEAKLKLLVAERDAKTARAAHIQGEAQISRQLLATLSQVIGRQLCPLCGADVTEKAALASKQKELVDKADAEHKILCAEAMALTKTIEKDRVNLTRLVQAYAATAQQVETAEATLKSIPKPDADRTTIELALKMCKTQYETDAAALASLQTQQILAAQTLENNRHVLVSIAAEEAKLTALRTEATELLSQMQGYEGKSEAEVTATVRELEHSSASYTQCERELATRQGTIQTLSVQLSALEEDIATLSAKRDAQAAYVKATEVLGNVKQWFHYENGPHAVTSAVLKELTPNVNFFLGKLSAPFVVTADLDAVGFRYQMTDGTQMPDDLPNAKALSGAQKNMLAMAFRLASYCMFAAKLGVLVLDEPTAHLDQDNVGKFGELLARIQQIAIDMDLQILIVTHHSEILSFCDSTISLGK